ncbi:MAG: NAD(P)/FAD-dependent oxidoreductase [Candidatus Neomicrothrix subdominans]
MAEQRSTVVVVGGGFAGVGCATRLARHDVAVTLLDRNNYHQFQPLLYQVATAELAVVDVARPLRGIFARHPSVRVKRVDVVSVDVDVDGRSVTTADGDTFGGDYLVLAAGSKPNFFNTPGAQQHAFPLYSVADANRLRNRLFEVFEEADNDATLIDRGALNIVVVGAGPTGVETAGAVADLVNDVMPKRYRDLDLDRVAITIVDLGPAVLGPFSDTASAYATKRLGTLGVNLRLKTGVEEVTAEGVLLSDGTEIASRTVVWAGGITAPDLAAASGLDAGRGGRLTAQPDLTVDGHPSVYAIGDMANMTDDTGQALPQLGSVALQAGRWAARNILADVDGRQREPFRYRDKGIMAMVGRGSAVAEVGKRHHELHGTVAFAAWLGVHAWLMSGVRQRVDAFVSWAWDFLGASRGDAVIETDSARIDWGDQDPTDESP